jgi:uncharacterized protein YndB with AHSA1/START domain
MSVSSLALSVAVSAATMAATPAAAGDRILRAEIDVPASREAVWAAWTTEAGIKTFFAPAAHIEPRVDGAYEIFFDPEAQPGRRGGDGMRILVFEPPRRISFTWNAPLTQPLVRAQRTVVTLELAAIDAGHTRLRFTHAGWGEGPEWDAAYAYFDSAWGKVVLPSLLRRFASGPVDWKNRGPLQPVAASLRAELVAR